jgi:hypothetical protein
MLPFYNGFHSYWSHRQQVASMVFYIAPAGVLSLLAIRTNTSATHCRHSARRGVVNMSHKGMGPSLAVVGSATAAVLEVYADLVPASTLVLSR